MKSANIVAVALAAMAAVSAPAQGTRVFRCPGNSYTNSEVEAKAKGCKPMDGGSITVVEGTKANGASGTRVATAPGVSDRDRPRVDATEQRQRDSDARSILEAELKKAEERRDELAKEYNNGEPEMLGPEHKNHQKYLDRIAELKASIARNENDIAGIRRELARAGSSAIQ